MTIVFKVMARLHHLSDACLTYMVLGIFDLVAWALNRYTLREPW